MISDFLLWACTLCGLFLMARYASWALALLCVARQRGVHHARAELVAVRCFPQWLVRLGGFLLAAIPLAASAGVPQISVAALFLLLAWRVIHYSENRHQAGFAVAGVVVLAVIIAVTGGRV
jgi:hypothetical protein